ncbi:MAG: hypothetical protein HQ596_05035 [Candidatus Saganbacteria bacterium]|nr:hypothetical protein [Candidatus Saganbacteria bacterium]
MSFTSKTMFVARTALAPLIWAALSPKEKVGNRFVTYAGLAASLKEHPWGKGPLGANLSGRFQRGGLTLDGLVKLAVAGPEELRPIAVNVIIERPAIISAVLDVLEREYLYKESTTGHRLLTRHTDSARRVLQDLLAGVEPILQPPPGVKERLEQLIDLPMG